MTLKDLLVFLENYWLYVLVFCFLFLPSLVGCYLRLLDFISGKSKREAKQRELEQLDLNLKKRETELLLRSSNVARQEKALNEQVCLRTINLVRNIASRDYLQETPTFRMISESTPSLYPKLLSTLTSSMQISSPFDISATIKSGSNTSYHTTLHSCTCPDFTFRKEPCKHMLRLALEVGLLFNYTTDSLNAEIVDLIQNRDHLKSEVHTLTQAKEKFLQTTQQSYPWLANLYDEYCKIEENSLVHFLHAKTRPADATARDIEKIINQDLSFWRSQAKQNEYQLHFYETLFPWLSSFKEVPPIEAFGYVSATESTSSEDQALLSRSLSPEELAKLPKTAQYQLALDRYINRKKNLWEIGIEYERYIGYLCEQNDYRVSYNGATARLEDMGRDLILEKDSLTILIQCKRWSHKKTIHENHVFQLAGSVFEYQFQHPEKKVIGAFVTTTDFSQIAKHCADLLDIRLIPNISFQEYPRIKCNINRNSPDGVSYIYHLPMDQQYDNVKISDPGEFYVATVQEAVDSGFRRAYDWSGNN